VAEADDDLARDDCAGLDQFDPDNPPRWTDYQRLDDLVPDPRNPKLHADAELDASLKRFGFTEAVMVDERTGLLVSGHGRRELVLRARAAGDPLPEGVVVDATGAWMVPVQRGWSSKNDEEAGAYLAAANLLTTRGGWHDDGLATLMQLVATTEAGLAGVGMTDTELADLLASLAPPPSLDDLGARYGDPQESDLYPVMRFKIAPALKERWLRLAGGVSNDDAAQFAYVLELAERARATMDADKAKAS
jgi:hypothetical protein